MTRILFICHGNICRSPAAEFILLDMLAKAGRKNEFCVSSAAISDEELGNAVYPPMRKLLAAHGIDCSGKTARQITRDDYDRYDLIIYMDERNHRALMRAFGSDPDGKFRNLLDYAGKPGAEIDDPWYTRQFQTAWDEIYEGCEGLFRILTEEKTVTIDFSRCMSRGDLYNELRRKMEWQDWYGETLDALWDILTGLPHKGTAFVIIPPGEDAAENVKNYAARIRSVFEEADMLIP